MKNIKIIVVCKNGENGVLKSRHILELKIKKIKYISISLVTYHLIMLVAVSLDSWKRAKHSPRVQVKAISFIVSNIILLSIYYVYSIDVAAVASRQRHAQIYRAATPDMPSCEGRI